MILGAKEVHNLKRELTNLDQGVSTAQRLCLIANIDTTRILIDGVTPWKRWNNIIDFVITDLGKTAALLKAVLGENAGNEELEYYLSEITTKNEIRLGALAGLLKEKKCVLFLGPDVLQVMGRGPNISFNTHLCNILKAKLDDQNMYYDPALGSNLHYISQCYTEIPMYVAGDVQRIAKDEFDKIISGQNIETTLLSLVAQIPTRLIINTNPDILIRGYIESQTNSKCLMASYDISNNAISEGNPGSQPNTNNKTDSDAPDDQDIKSIPESEVFVYNIFGAFDRENSILHTEGQFLEFINKVILGNPTLNSTVRKELNDQESYLFIGFDFEQWYFKILFKLLKLKRGKDKAISCNFDLTNVSVINKEFFEEEFRVYFINDDIRAFIRSLLARIKNLT